LQEQLLGSHDSQSTLLKRQYRYDAAGQLTNIHDSRRGALEYQYDPVGRLLKATSRLGVEIFAFDPAGNLLDQKTQELNRPLEADPRRNKLMDNLLREYAGTHYRYDERGNLVHRLHNGAHAHFTWDLFDRLTGYNDDKLKVDYSYDALGRRLHKHSVAHFWDRPEAGTGWNQLQRAKRQRELGCGFTLFGWDGDTLAWESSPPLDEGDTGRTVHYLYEPDSFVPVAQALRKSPIRLYKQPDWSQREYDFDQDPLWHTEVKPQAFEAIAWYHCDHLGTPMELTDEQGNIAWAGQYKAWGEVREERSVWAKQHGLGNPIRFQGQYHDHETGLHYNRYRYYDAANGRFIGKDPISFVGGLNVYAYAFNPTQWTDPLGLSPQSIAKAVVELRAGRSVTVCSFKDASAVLFGAFPGAQKSAGAGDKDPSKTARDKASFKSNRQNGSGLASYHMDFKINSATGVLYGHESLPNGHPHKTIPHVNVITPEGKRADIFVERRTSCPRR
jgi:RHS repeat-associated protein